MDSLALLTDAALHSETKRLVGNSNGLTAQLLAHLGEVEARGIHRVRACSSLAVTPRGPRPRSMYCVYELRMSEDEAQRRCRAARLARQFPILLEMLAEASLHLTGVLLIGPHLTDENCAELLARARFRSKREIERLIAEIAPCRDVPSKIVPLHRAGAVEWMLAPLDEDSAGLWAPPRNTWAAYVRGLAGAVRQLESGIGAGQAPPRASGEPIAAAMSCETSSDAPRDGETGTRTPALDERKGVRHDVQRDVSTPESCGELRPTSVPPVAEVRYKVQFTADQAYVDLLEEACSLLQHGLPGRDVLEVQRRALKLLVHELRQRKYAACERPCPKAAKPANDTPQPKCTLARPPELQSSTRAPRAALQSARDARQSTQQSARDARHFASQAMPHSGSSAGKSASQSRYIPAKVRRSVWKRDEARCAFVDARGQRCREQSGLEFHHQHPHARGGPPSAENIALRCRSHNALAAEQDFGRDVVREKRARKRERGAAEPRWRSARGVESSRAGAVPAESSPAVLAWCRERAEAIRAGAVPAESSPGAGAVP